jgi:hypothetical protein
MIKKFIASLNKKHTQQEVCSFEFDFFVHSSLDPNDLGIRLDAASLACIHTSLPQEYKNFDSSIYWMDAVCLE